MLWPGGCGSRFNVVFIIIIINIIIIIIAINTNDRDGNVISNFIEQYVLRRNVIINYAKRAHARAHIVVVVLPETKKYDGRTSGEGCVRDTNAAVEMAMTKVETRPALAVTASSDAGGPAAAIAHYGQRRTNYFKVHTQ